MKRTLIVILMSITLILSTSINSFADNESTHLDTNVIKIESEDQIPAAVRYAMDNQWEALENYQQIMESFEEDSSGTIVYPHEYAGAYIEDCKLIIQLTDNSKSNQMKYQDLCDNPEQLEFTEANYSINDLLSYKIYAEEEMQKRQDVVGYAISEKNNEFVIYLNQDSATPATISTLDGDTENLPIRFETMEVPVACATLRGGFSLESSGITSSDSTLGICGTYDGQNAILTCGHGNTETDTILYNGSAIGTVEYQRLNKNPNGSGTEIMGDFSIVLLNSSQTITNTVMGTDGIKQITGTYSSLPEGTTIYKYGATTGYGYGTVLESAISSKTTYNLSDEDGNVLGTCYVAGLYRSSMSALDHGDSGGPVYIKSGSSYLLHGIVTAKINSYLYSTPIFFPVDQGFSVKTN